MAEGIRCSEISKVGNKYYTVYIYGDKKINIQTLLCSDDTFGRFNYQFYKTHEEAESYLKKDNLINLIKCNVSYFNWNKLTIDALETINQITQNTK